MSDNSNPGKYIIVFKKTADERRILALRENIKNEKGTVGESIRMGDSYHALPATLPDHMLQSFTENSDIDYIEPDGPVSIYAQDVLNKSKKPAA